jgi:hypothetical protein
MPEAGGQVDSASEQDEQAMTVLGLSSKREVTRTSIRVRTAMAVQAREQGRYLGGARRTGTGRVMPVRTRGTRRSEDAQPVVDRHYHHIPMVARRWASKKLPGSDGAVTVNPRHGDSGDAGARAFRDPLAVLGGGEGGLEAAASTLPARILRMWGDAAVCWLGRSGSARRIATLCRDATNGDIPLLFARLGRGIQRPPRPVSQ